MATGDLTCTMDPEDLRRINERLNQLGDVVKTGIVQKGLREGANIILQEVKSSISRHGFIKTGKLLRSATIKSRKKDGKIYIGYKRDDGNGAHILDKGTVIRHTRTGANRGRIVASNFHSQAVNAKKDQALDAVYRSIQESLDRLWNR